MTNNNDKKQQINYQLNKFNLISGDYEIVKSYAEVAVQDDGEDEIEYKGLAIVFSKDQLEFSALNTNEHGVIDERQFLDEEFVCIIKIGCKQNLGSDDEGRNSINISIRKLNDFRREILKSEFPKLDDDFEEFDYKL